MFSGDNQPHSRPPLPKSSPTLGPSPLSVESTTSSLPQAETSLNGSASGIAYTKMCFFRRNINSVYFSGGKARWTHNATLYLISTYEDKQNLITSNTIRRAEAWKEVAAHLAAAGFSYSAGQCECKFQSLRKLYLKKKDNMAAGSSGHERVDFTYYDELDKLFGKSPIVKPVAIASSSRANNHHGFTEQELNDMGVTDTDLENMSVEELEQLFPVKKKGNKKRNIDLVVDAIQEMDTKRQKRHNEIVSVLKEGQKDFRDIMRQLLGTMTQRQRQTSGDED
jgi:Myb/SANT-like DNA-binding domain